MSLNFITKLLVLLLLPLLFTAVSCNKPTEPPPPENYALEIIAVDASCTEVWLDVKTPNTLLPQSFTLTENGEEKGSVTIDKADTTIVIENLLPNKSYKYQLKNTEHKSNETEITTLDTTSPNFTWQTFEFGQHSSSVLYDVAIIDENNIWAVGEIYMNDANGDPDPQAYNAVRWDGTKWELKRITVLYNGNNITPTLYGVFALSPTDIWFSSGVPIKGDGTNWIQYHLFDMGILSHQDGYLTKVWGSSSNDIYYVGTLGTIAHWNGSSWKKIESGTGLHFSDIFGEVDTKTKKYEIIAVALQSIPMDFGIYLLSNHSVNEISKNNVPWSIMSVWFKPNRHYYVVGYGIYEKKRLGDTVWKDNGYTITQKATSRIRGNGLNDVYVAGALGELLHYNGVSWKSLANEIGNQSTTYKSLSVDKKTIVVVGYNGIHAVIIKLTKTE